MLEYELATTQSNELMNYALFIASELRASSPYRTGNMQRSIIVVTIDEVTVDIIIGVDYATFVNERSPHKGWVQTVVERASRAYAGGAVDCDYDRTPQDEVAVWQGGQ